ncbi:MAG: tetratricopeptide repeat protein, partial [Desulfobacterales bacterium]
NTMERFQPTIGPKPAADAMTFTHPSSMTAVSNTVTADYGILSKLIEKQVSRANGHHVKDIQWQLNQFVSDLSKQFDRVLEENQRLLKTLEELQGGQDYLLQQLELHHKREELAILREQQDGKRIRELENRLSFLLFEPIQNQRIAIDAPELRRFAIHQPELIEKTKEPQEVQGMALTPSEDDQVAETSLGDTGSGVADTLSESENPCVPPLPSAAEDELSYTDEFETAGEVPPLEARGADLVLDSLVEDVLPSQLGEEPVDRPPEADAAVDEESDIIDLLEEVVDTPQEEDNMLADTAVSEAAIPDVGAPEYMNEVDEPVESSSLNTNFVLQEPREAMIAAAEADSEANATKEELVSIITLQDEIPAVRSLDVGPSIEVAEEDSGQIVKELSRESFGETALDGADNAVLPDCPVSPGIEECLETVEEADTNSFDIIELKEDAIVGQPENTAAKSVTNLPHEPVTVPVEEDVVDATGEPFVSKEAGLLSKEQQRKPTDAKVHFDRGKLACQSKDYAKAVDSFNRYLELSPNDPRGPYNLAILHYRLKEYTRAAANARKALDLGYTAADRIMAKIKTKTESKAESDIAVEKSVSDPWLETETVNNLSLTEPAAETEEKGEATAYRDAGNSPDAVLPITHTAVLEDNLFEPATVDPSRGAIDPLLSDETASIDPAAVTASQKSFPAGPDEPGDQAAAKQFFADGMAAYQKKEYRTGVEHFRGFVALMPDEPKGHYNLAILHYRLKEYETALDCARRAQGLGGGSAQKIIQKIESKIARQRSSDEKSAVVDATQELFEDRMNFPATEIDDSTGAEDTASIWDADELGEEINQSLFSAATEENQTGKKDDLIVFDSAALDEKNFAEDEAAGSSATVPDKGDPEQFFQNERLKNIFKLGQIAVENKEYLKAIQHFTKITHLAPQDPRGYYHLAEVSFQLRFYETARQHANRAIELGSAAAKNILSQIGALQVPA